MKIVYFDRTIDNGSQSQCNLKITSELIGINSCLSFKNLITQECFLLEKDRTKLIIWKESLLKTICLIWMNRVFFIIPLAPCSMEFHICLLILILFAIIEKIRNRQASHQVLSSNLEYSNPNSVIATIDDAIDLVECSQALCLYALFIFNYVGNIMLPQVALLSLIQSFHLACLFVLSIWLSRLHCNIPWSGNSDSCFWSFRIVLWH